MAQVVTLGNCLNVLGFKVIRSVFELFNVASEEQKSKCYENNCKREESLLEYKFIEELKEQGVQGKEK